MDDLIAQDHELFHHHHHPPPTTAATTTTATAALPNPKRIKLNIGYKMPYHRPIYQPNPQPYHAHYQQRLLHASLGPPPPAPNVFSPPQARHQQHHHQQQHFIQSQSQHNVHCGASASMGPFNQGYNRQAANGMTGFSIQPQHVANTPTTTMMMMDNTIEQGDGGDGDDSSRGDDASQDFPDEAYLYCEYNRPNQNPLSPKQIQPPDSAAAAAAVAFYQAHDQDIAAAADRRHYYVNVAANATSDFQTNDDCVGAMPQSQFVGVQRPARVYHDHHQLSHHNHQHQHHQHRTQFGVMHQPGIQNHPHQRQQQQQQQQTRYYKTPAELAAHPHHRHHQEPARPYGADRGPQPIYSDQLDDNYLDEFHEPHHPQPPAPLMRQDYIINRQSAATTTRRIERFQGSQYSDGPIMGQMVEGQQLYQHASDEQQQQQQQHHTVQPEQLVRQEMGLNPRKISRVSASAITSPCAASSYHSAARHPAAIDSQYSNGDTDTYRVVVSTSPDENASHDEQHAQQQLAYSSMAFVESVSSDQTEEYSSFESSPPAAAAATVGLNGNQSQQQQQQSQGSQSIATSQQQQGNYIDMRSSGTVSQDWLDMICRHMIEHMNNFGICVIDNFLGSIKGEAILSEVLQLYSERNYTTGRLVSDVRDDQKNGGGGSANAESRADSKEVAAAVVSRERQQKLAAADPARLIRNDRVIWVDGCENGCSEINNLIQTLCSVITNSSRLSLYTGNALDKIVINKRTKAHVACYPGNRTRYIKHVDNPNNDGRVITAIYYLNKNWSTKRDGGLLRMFPAGMDTVANIEPLFDRVLFFWSDRRNPHEVLPAFRDRFAITVWYIASETSR